MEGKTTGVSSRGRAQFLTRCFILALVSGLRDGQKGRMNPSAHIAHISIPVDR